jgi:hypothetical protein
MRGSVRQICQTLSAQAALVLEKQIASEKGLGREIVAKFLEDVPGISRPQIQDYFATIKACGEYANIIGEVSAEIEVENREAVLIYAAENATQRGESSTAGVGTVAAATWLLARAIMRGQLSQIWDNLPSGSLETLQGNIASAKGLGVPVIAKFLEDVPGIKRPSIDDYFATIKACGEYARRAQEADSKTSIHFEFQKSIFKYRSPKMQIRLNSP